MHYRNYIREAEAILFHRLGYRLNLPRAHNLNLWSLTLWGSSWYTISPHRRSAHCPIKRSFNLYGKTKYQSSPSHIHFFYAWSSLFPPCICITKRLTLDIFHMYINSTKSLAHFSQGTCLNFIVKLRCAIRLLCSWIYLWTWHFS